MMDQIISLIQSSLDSPTLDTDYASQCDTLAVQPLPQPSCSNQSLALLKAFCSDEDTVKSYLLDGDQLNNQNDGQFVDSSTQTYDYTENLLNFNDQTVQPHGLWAVDNLINLLSNIYNSLNLMEAVLNYDATIDGWDVSNYNQLELFLRTGSLIFVFLRHSQFAGFKYDRRDTFIFNKHLHDGLVHVIETFPDRFRNDINVIILMYLIIIFNADIIGLKYPEMIRFSHIIMERPKFISNKRPKMIRKHINPAIF
uniref:Uncharacterized protein n=1 Tax=Tetranychus urticae TaxID=32264 RepID=T1KHT9_TETUR